MPRHSRYRSTATVKRVTNTSDGYGGLVEAETTVATGYKFMYWHLSPWDRESVVLKYGLEEDTILRLGTGQFVLDGDGNLVVRNNDILQVSSTERWQVLTTNEVFGRNNETPVSIGLLIAKAGSA